jgi:hypothetical protein
MGVFDRFYLFFRKSSQYLSLVYIGWVIKRDRRGITPLHGMLHPVEVPLHYMRFLQLIPVLS